jgi:pyruvate,water dikinase
MSTAMAGRDNMCGDREQSASDADSKALTSAGLTRRLADVTAPSASATFPAPHEIAGFWAWDKMHAPRPLSPLASDLIIPGFAAGFTAAQAEFDSPLEFSCRMVNYYLYGSFHPIADETGAAQRAARYKDTLAEKAPRVGDRWKRDWEPRLVAAAERARTTDYSVMSDEEILATLDEYVRHMTDQWTIHGRVNFVLVVTSRFCDFYQEVIKPSDPADAYQVLQGFETRSVDAARGLWRLSRFIRSKPGLMNQFKALDATALVRSLETTTEGRDFLAELRHYLDEFGWRSDAVYDIADVTWREDPSIPLAALQGYVGLGDDADPDVMFVRGVETRERLLAEARAQLAHDPERLRNFEELYEAARHYLPLTENHAFWIDQMGVAIFRRFVLEIGRRLQERGILDVADEVFLLYRDELVDALRNGGPRQAVVARRRAEMAAWAQVDPPPTLGEPPPAADDPFLDAVAVRLLGRVPPKANPDPNVLTGIGGSPGVVQGTARVLRSLAEATKLEDGDIMVCEMTLPPWTPLFSLVNGIVTDTGGALSHCAIVAREYGLPAVVGTLVGTTVITDGMTITVDGTKGTVRIDARP